MIRIAYSGGIRLVDTSQTITTAVQADRPFASAFGLFTPVIQSVTALVKSTKRRFQISLAVPAVGTCLSNAFDTPCMKGVEGHIHDGINSIGSRLVWTEKGRR
jgi:hypothetical protein